MHKITFAGLSTLNRCKHTVYMRNLRLNSTPTVSAETILGDRLKEKQKQYQVLVHHEPPGQLQLQ